MKRIAGLKRLAGLALAAAAFSLTAPAAVAEPITYFASLSGANESPPIASDGTGSATVIYDAEAHTLLVDVSFSGLTGATTVAHIHCCTALPLEGTAGVATPTPTFPGFPTGVTSGSYSETFDLTSAGSWNPSFLTANGSVAGAEAALAAGLADGKAYLNIHTSFAGGGEIRGFLTVPEPGVLALFGAALLGLGFGRRRALGQSVRLASASG